MQDERSVTRAVGMGPMPAMLDAVAGPGAVEAAFSRADLPTALVDERHHFVPLSAMMDLYEHAAALAGDPAFGLRIGLEMEPETYGDPIEYALQARTLRGATQRLSLTVSLHQPGAWVGLRRLGPHVCLGYIPPVEGDIGHTQHADHVLPGLIHLARRYLGAEWTPGHVFVPYGRCKSHASRLELVPAIWHFGTELVGVALPEAKLDRPVAIRRKSAPLTGCELLTRSAAAEVGRTSVVQLAVRMTELAVLGGETDLDSVARRTGLGGRTLQRRLQEAGTTFRDVLDRVRLSRAKALLIETDTSLTEIAFILGYSEPASFTRAYRRHNGCAPMSTRRAHRKRSRTVVPAPLDRSEANIPHCDVS